MKIYYLIMAMISIPLMALLILASIFLIQILGGII